MPHLERILVTGGAGFLGRALVRELLPELRDPDRPLREIRIFDRAPGEPDEPGVIAIRGDVVDGQALVEACCGVDAVIHAASLVDWGHVPPARLRAVNVAGTERVLEACRANGVQALVYTSSMDVVCGGRPVVDVDETFPFPERFLNLYSETKAQAEQLVLAANDPGHASAPIRTCALRPAGMYGEGDPYHVPNVVRVVRSGQLGFRPGNGRARFHHVYVGNVAHAHVLATKRLLAGDERVSGARYFVVDDSPLENFFVFMEPILEAVGHPLPPRNRTVPYPLLLVLGTIVEAAAALCRPFVQWSPALTRSSIRLVCHDHTFDGSRAREELGYKPVYGNDESLARTIEWLRAEIARGAFDAD
ncbi:MAG: NAD-dependent epimerase/dehydratase family protein [Spirochaetaceae bacterium]|nr:NAD-dependent epimerase/dehydratase family protein [Spirochaetaceae bacterium]